MRLKDIKKTSI